METPSQDFRLSNAFPCFRDESTSSRMASAAFPQWYVDSCLSLLDAFGGTTLLIPSPLLVGRPYHKNDNFPSEVFSINSFRRCPGASSST